MVIKKIVQIGNLEAREVSTEVASIMDPRVQEIIQNLLDTMIPADLIGMSAPQIGHNLRIFVTHMRSASKSKQDASDDGQRVFVNPKITYFSESRETKYEGCGSVANAQIFGPVERSKKVKISALDEKGKPFELEASGLLARIIQHENDHLDGVFFTDRVEDNRDLMSIQEYIKAREEKRI